MVMSQMRDRQGRTNTEGQGQADRQRDREKGRQAGRQSQTDRQTETEADNPGKLLSFLNCFALN